MIRHSRSPSVLIISRVIVTESYCSTSWNGIFSETIVALWNSKPLQHERTWWWSFLETFWPLLQLIRSSQHSAGMCQSSMYNSHNFKGLCAVKVPTHLMQTGTLWDFISIFSGIRYDWILEPWGTSFTAFDFFLRPEITFMIKTNLTHYYVLT